MPASPAPHDRVLTAALVWAAGSLAAVVVTLALMTIDRTPSDAAGTGNLAALWPFWIASASAWAALTWLWRIQTQRRQAPSRRRFLRVALIVLSVATAARLAVLLTHDPTLSDDVYRYVFDGRNAAHGVNPYLVTPAERRGDTERWVGESVIVELVNNPELHTIYLPTSQFVFAAAGWLTPDDVDDPRTLVRSFRAVFVLFELGAMTLVLLALRHAKQSPWWLALYAWHPLPLAEIAGSGHQDAIGLALLVAALVIYTISPKRLFGWIALLAVAVLVKPIVLPAAALMLRGRNWRRWAIAAGIGFVVCVAIAVPLLIADDGAALTNMRATAERFSLKWAHFGSVYEPLLRGIEKFTPDWANDPQEQLARKICVALLGLVVLGVWLRGREAWHDCATIFLAMVLLTPAAHPWYLLWALVLTPVSPSRAVWVASLTLPWGYVVLGDPVEWTVPTWVMVVAYAPIYAVLVMDLARAVRKPDNLRS